MRVVPQLVSPLQLLGEWRLDRRLIDRRTGQHGTVRGRLVLASDGTGVRWSEQGELQWGGALFPISRELTIVADQLGWQVCFRDGRPFHRWQPGSVVVHPCRADSYCGLITVDRSRTRMRVLWDVVGPAKQQRILTRYQAAIGQAEPDVASDRRRG